MFRSVAAVASAFALPYVSVGEDVVRPSETDLEGALGDDNECAGLDAAECSTKLIQLRGLRAKSLAAADPDEDEIYVIPEDAVWTPLGHLKVAKDEGKELFEAHGDPKFCGEICSKYPECKSFAYCGNKACYMKTEQISASTSSVGNEFCTTYYPGPAGSKVPDTDSGQSEDKPEEPKASDCHTMKSTLKVNSKQEFKENPDAKSTGEATLLLCSNGTVKANLTVDDAASDIIATHVHHCADGKDAETCAGPPILNFCGDNSAGLIADGTKYTMACSGYKELTDGYTGKATSSESITLDMPGAFTKKAKTPMADSDRISDMIAHPDQYYFNVHTMASYNHWYPKHEGMIRGPLVDEEAKPDTTDKKPPGENVKDNCYLMFAQMMVNELQEFHGNPDSSLKGYTDLVLCTNGTLKATLLVYGGVSQIIATHIHMCQDENALAKDGCEGPPVINFCGINGAGSIDDGTKYPEKCADYNKIGASRTKDSSGVLIEVTNPDTTLAERVAQIAKNPGRFYFNVHTMASWNHWYPKHHGSCRGALTFNH